MEIKLPEKFWQETKPYEVWDLPHTNYFHLGAVQGMHVQWPVLYNGSLKLPTKLIKWKF